MTPGLPPGPSAEIYVTGFYAAFDTILVDLDHFHANLKALASVIAFCKRTGWSTGHSSALEAVAVTF